MWNRQTGDQHLRYETNAPLEPERRAWNTPVGRVMLLLVVLALVAIKLVITTAQWGSRLSGRSKAAQTPARDVLGGYRALHQGHVDISTGVYIREDDDVALRNAPGFVLRRTYLSGYHVSRQFGIGATSNADWYLIGDGARFQWVALILADGGRIHYDRVSGGSTILNARFVHRLTPTRFYGSEVSWIGGSWRLRFRDGSRAWFEACGPGDTRTCSLVELRDAEDHGMAFVRNGDNAVERIEGAGQRLLFTHDKEQRITRITDGAEQQVDYAYDAAGRLIRATTKDGVTRSYEYGPHDELRSVLEPGRSIFNEFDAETRLIGQVTRMDGSAPGQHQDYKFRAVYTTANGAVTATDTFEDGAHTLYRFDERHYETLEIEEPDSPRAVIVSFDRDPIGQFVTALTIRCVAASGRRVTRTVQVEGQDEDVLRRQWVARECRTGR